MWLSLNSGGCCPQENADGDPSEPSAPGENAENGETGNSLPLKCISPHRGKYIRIAFVAVCLLRSNNYVHLIIDHAGVFLVKHNI